MGRYRKPLYIGIASYGALGHWGTYPLDFHQYFFSSLQSRTKSITANSNWFFIPYNFENVRNWSQREAFYDAIESTDIVFFFGRGTGGTYDAVLLIPQAAGEGACPSHSLPNRHPSASQSRHLGSCPLAPNPGDVMHCPCTFQHPCLVVHVMFRSEDIRQSPLSLGVVEKPNKCFWPPIFGKDDPDFSTANNC